MSIPRDAGRLPTLEHLERELVRRAEAEPKVLVRRRVAVLVAAALVGTLLVATPFGRALAERLGDLVGIGDPPTRELLAPVGEPAVVIGVGEDPNGEPFEIVASSEPAFGRARRDGTCISIDFPTGGGAVAANCLTDALLAGLREDGISAVTGASSEASEYAVVSGVARPAATEVVVTAAVAGERVEREAQLARLGPGLAARIAADERTAFFVAFIPRDASSASASAYGPDGSLIGAQRVALIAPPP